MIKFLKKCWKVSKYYSIVTAFFVAETPITIGISSPGDKLSFVLAIAVMLAASVNIYNLLKMINSYEDGGLI